MIKVNLLEARMKEKNVWYPELCEYLNMLYQSLNKRINGKVEFRLSEVNKIRKFLDLTLEQADEIFYY
jgi:hypothetical protein